jgi:hypothetical protein
VFVLHCARNVTVYMPLLGVGSAHARVLLIAVGADEVALVDDLIAGTLAPVVDERDMVGQVYSIVVTVGAGAQLGDDGFFDEEEPVLQAGGRAQEEGEGV